MTEIKKSFQEEGPKIKSIDPASCRMWPHHNRDYSQLSKGSVEDLIVGLTKQGRQEFPAIVRKSSDPAFEYEVICGARCQVPLVYKPFS